MVRRLGIADFESLTLSVSAVNRSVKPKKAIPMMGVEGGGQGGLPHCQTQTSNNQCKLMITKDKPHIHA